MRKYLLVAATLLFTSAVVTASVSAEKKTSKASKCCVKKSHCPRQANVACY
jgi:hypothetical protein